MRVGGETEEEEVEKEQLQDQLLPSDASQRFVFFNTESIKSDRSGQAATENRCHHHFTPPRCCFNLLSLSISQVESVSSAPSHHFPMVVVGQINNITTILTTSSIQIRIDRI